MDRLNQLLQANIRYQTALHHDPDSGDEYSPHLLGLLTSIQTLVTQGGQLKNVRDFLEKEDPNNTVPDVILDSIEEELTRG